MRTKRILETIVLLIISAIIIGKNYQPVMAAEKLSKGDFTAKINEETETYNFYDDLNEAGEGTILYVYNKDYDKSEKGAIKTSRGIYIGSKSSAVTKQYGKGTKGNLLKDTAYIGILKWSGDFSPYFKNVDYVLSYDYEDKSKQGEVYTSRLHFYIDKNEKVAAIVFSRNYKEGKKSKLYYYNKGNSFYESGNYSAAIAYLNICIKIDDEYTDAYIVKGDSLYYLNRFSEAVEYYDKAIKLPLGDTAYVYYSKGLALYFSDKYEESINAFDIAIEKDSSFIDVYNRKGYSLIMIGNYDDARKMFDKVLEMQPDHIGAYNGKGDIYYYQDQYIAAIEYYDQAISKDPTDLTAYVNKVLCLYFSNNYSECLILCDKIIDIDVNYAFAYYTKSKIYAIQKNEVEFLKNFKKAVEIDLSYIEYAETEEAFDSYRDSGEFIKIITISYK